MGHRGWSGDKWGLPREGGHCDCLLTIDCSSRIKTQPELSSTFHSIYTQIEGTDTGDSRWLRGLLFLLVIKINLRLHRKKSQGKMLHNLNYNSRKFYKFSLVSLQFPESEALLICLAQCQWPDLAVGLIYQKVIWQIIINSRRCSSAWHRAGFNPPASHYIGLIIS